MDPRLKQHGLTVVEKLKQVTTENAALKARVAELEAAVKPAVKAWKEWVSNSECSPSEDVFDTMGDLVEASGGWDAEGGDR